MTKIVDFTNDNPGNIKAIAVKIDNDIYVAFPKGTEEKERGEFAKTIEERLKDE